MRVWIRRVCWYIFCRMGCSCRHGRGWIWITRLGQRVPLNHDRVATFPVCPIPTRKGEINRNIGATSIIFVWLDNNLDRWLGFIVALLLLLFIYVTYYSRFFLIYWSDRHFIVYRFLVSFPGLYLNVTIWHSSTPYKLIKNQILQFRLFISIKMLEKCHMKKLVCYNWEMRIFLSGFCW